MKFRHSFQSRTFRNSEPEDGGGGFVETPPAQEPVAAAATEPAPTLTLHEAMFGKPQATASEVEEAAAAGKTIQQLRDEKGRFAGKAPEAVPETAKPKPPAEKTDPNMPEGLSPKAQERFQALANTAKELNAKVAEYEPIVQSALGLQEVFREHGVRREQFEQAMEVVGLMNRGDLHGALKVLDQQRALISMHLGQPLPGADALGNFRDLREAVDNLQLTEQHALEIARQRTIEAQRQQAQQHQQREQQTQQQEQQQVQAGQLAVDKFCKQRMADDLDYAKIEPILLKEIQEGLLEGVPPARWAAIVQKTYGLIKQTAAATRTAGPSTGVLRPTGGESPRQTPQTMFDAMWGAKA